MVLSAVNTEDRTVQYNGKDATVKSESGAYLTVTTENGETISVPKSSPLLSFGNKDELEKILYENKQKIKAYKQAWTNATNEKRSYIQQIRNFWRDLGLQSGSYSSLNDKQEADYEELQDGKFDAITAMHRASNGVYSTVSDSLSAIYSFRRYA